MLVHLNFFVDTTATPDEIEAALIEIFKKTSDYQHRDLDIYQNCVNVYIDDLEDTARTRSCTKDAIDYILGLR